MIFLRGVLLPFIAGFLFLCFYPSVGFSLELIRALLVPELELSISGEIPATIRKMNVDIGDHFKKDQVLIEFDCDTLNAEARKARADLQEAEQVHQVNTRLQGYKSISDLEVAVSEARLEKARAEVSFWEVKQRKCSVKAPFAGQVISRQASPYEHIAPGQPLLEIVDNINLSLQLFVPSEWLAWLKSGTGFTVKIDETGKTYSAAITVHGAKVDPVSQTIEMRAKIKGNHPELLAGMSGTASFKKVK
ncbi:MAG: efflux RND transporter periplasmic adaptor subunit [Desulfobulbaceae bacterium]|nr:efflux RND transporter periplasmic adaptor subunit [Desulfobulbaceae bacterium]